MSKRLLIITLLIILWLPITSATIKTGQKIELYIDLYRNEGPQYSPSNGFDFEKEESGSISFGLQPDFIVCIDKKNDDKMLTLCDPDLDVVGTEEEVEGLFVDLGETNLDSIEECYGKEYVNSYVRALSKHVYCIRTEDRNYAKIKVYDVKEGYKNPAHNQNYWTYSLYFDYIFEEIPEITEEDISIVEDEEGNVINIIPVEGQKTESTNEPKTITHKKFLSYLVGIVIILILVIIFISIIKLNKSKGFIKVEKTAKEKKTEEPKKEVIKEEVKKETKRLPFNPNINEVISVSNFTLKAGKNIILEDVSFEVNKGDMVCLLGPSGTGKSTVIESLVGRKTPTKGYLKILGEDITKNKRIYDYVGFVPQHPELYMNQTVTQNLLNSATKWGIKNAKEKAEKILRQIQLSNRTDLKASKLSGGQLKLLSLGMELIRDPELLILDEPTTGLDPNTRNNIITMLSQIATQLHKTVLFTTHFMDDAEECDEVIILSEAKIVTQGPPAKLEKRLPGNGKIVNVILDNVTDELLEKIKKIEGVEKIVREGRSLKIITNEPNAVRLGQKIDEVGGTVNKTELVSATMKEVFVYYTGRELKEE